MWWNDIKDIKEWMVTISARMKGLEMTFGQLCDQKKEDEEHSLDDVYHRLSEILYTCEDTQKELPKISKLVNPDNLAETYEKHISRIESMMIEFKGCVSLARAVVAERKEQQREFEELKDLARISKQIYNSMQSFIEAGNQLEHKNYFKLDAIYRKICEINDENPKKKGNSRKKSGFYSFPLILIVLIELSKICINIFL